MRRRCGSSKPTPTHLTVCLAMEPGTREEKQLKETQIYRYLQQGHHNNISASIASLVDKSRRRGKRTSFQWKWPELAWIVRPTVYRTDESRPDPCPRQSRLC